MPRLGKSIERGARGVVWLGLLSLVGCSDGPLQDPLALRPETGAVAAQPASSELQEAAEPSAAEPLEQDAQTVGMQIVVQGIQVGGGPVRVAVFDQPAGFPDPVHAVWTTTLEANAEQRSVMIPELKASLLAVGVYQDQDDDGKLSRGAFRMPTEPYGFSQNARGRWGPPTFEQAGVKSVEGMRQIEIRLE